MCVVISILLSKKATTKTPNEEKLVMLGDLKMNCERAAKFKRLTTHGERGPCKNIFPFFKVFVNICRVYGEWALDNFLF